MPNAITLVDAIPLPTSPEQGDILYYSGSAWVVLHHDDAGKILKTGGHAANPSWTTAAGGGDFLVMQVFG